MALATTLPAELINRINTILLNQLQKVTETNQLIQSTAINLPSSVSCSSPEIANLKKLLANGIVIINNLKLISNKLNAIINIINTINTLSTVINSAQLLIPSVPGVPSGPIAKILQLTTVLSATCKSSVVRLENMKKTIQLNVNRCSNVIAYGVDTCSNICPNETFNVTSDIANNIVNNNIVNNNLDSKDKSHISKFYNIDNVSDTDLKSYDDDIRQLNLEARDILSNLIETPSSVLEGIVDPLPETGHIGDFYINNSTKMIFGPKISESNWGTGIKY